MRLYFDFGQLTSFRHKEIKKELCEIACTYPNFDICDASNLPGTPIEDASQIFPKNWRFFPTLDPQVNFQKDLNNNQPLNPLKIKGNSIGSEASTKLSKI